MVSKVNGSGRRLLTFPAVHPCESISPSTLLASVIDLAEHICSFKSVVFPICKRNVRETVRIVQDLMIFLEDIRVGSVPGSVVLCLSELHLTFQRIVYLLEDCNLEGARTWILMKSDRVANQFRVFIRAIATSLDVLPLEAVDISSDVKEIVELVMRQARKARFDVDPVDKRVMDEVTRILGLYENGVDPDRREIKQVLDYIGIRNWSLCNQEVKFLDAEIETEYLNDEKRRESSLLSSLMGFMCYCRCVLFDVVDIEEASQQHNTKCSKNTFRGLNPDDFRCPISLEIMKDPVTLSTGHTYDLAAILKWFRAGNLTCPKTGEKLKSKDLVSNLVLKRIIQDWCLENGVSVPPEDSKQKNRDITRTVLAGSLAAEGALRMSACFLAGKLVDGTSEEQNKSAYEIRLLTKTSIFIRSCLVEAGVVPSLLSLLSSTDSITQENAMAGLLNLSKHGKSKTVMVENGGLDSIINVLKMGLNRESKQLAAATLFYIASIEEYRILIGENPDVIPSLVEMIRNGTDRCKKNALVAIFGLLMHPGNNYRVIAAGAVPLLLNILTSSDRDDLITDSLAVLATLAEKLGGTIAILRQGCSSKIVEILGSTTSRTAKEYCVSILLALCSNGGANVVAVLVKSPSLMGSLYSVLNEGTPRASKKARALIRVLHEFYERSASDLVASVPHQDHHPVHVW